VGLPGQEAYPEPAELPAEAARQRLFTYLAETFQARAQEGPLLLVFDDLQWADELTLGFLELVLQAGHSRQWRAAPVLVLGTYRTEEVHPALQRLLEEPGAQRLELGRLEEEAVGAMVAEMLALPGRPELFIHFLSRHSEGNPFFVAEYLHTAVSEGVLYRDGTGRWQVGAKAEGKATEALYEELPLPSSLRELVGRKLERLSPEARGLAEIAAVLGREVDAELLEAAAARVGMQLADGVDELLGRQVLTEPEAGRLRFAHDKIREVASERIAADRRGALHRAAAEGIEHRFEAQRGEHLAALGHHWEEAGERSRARQSYLAGARLAKDRYAYSEAERLYRAYLRLVEGPTTERILARNELGFEVLRNQGRASEALPEHRRSLQEARERGDRIAEAHSLHMMGVIHREIGELAEACMLHEQALEIQRQIGARRNEGRTLGNLALFYAEQGRHEQARVLYGQSLEIKRELGERREEGLTLGNLAVLYADEGRSAEARALYEQALAIIREVGDRQLQGVVMGNLAELLAETGCPEEAYALYEQAIAIHRETGNRPFEGVTLSYMANLHAVQGRLQEASGLHEQALAIHREVSDRRNEGITLMRRATLERRTGKIAEAEALSKQARQILEALGDTPTVAVCLCEHGHLALAQDRPARDLLMRAQELAASLQASPESELRRAVSRLHRAVEAFEAGQRERLFRGELAEDLPEGLRRRIGSSDERRGQP
jgi:tetratricopeptide (TPR) repeat protein